MAWRVELEAEVLKDLKKLDRQVAVRIMKFLVTRISGSENPRNIGESLQGNRLGEFWKYRVGDFRLICRIEDEILRVLVIKVGHRRAVYRP